MSYSGMHRDASTSAMMGSMMPRPATAHDAGVPYLLERHVLAGVPLLLERPYGDLRGLVVVHHGVTAAKEVHVGVFTPLVRYGVAVAYPDAAGHGELACPGLSSDAVGHRNFVWLCAARTAETAPHVLSELRRVFPGVPAGVIGVSMGGYTAHYLAMLDVDMRAVAVVSGDGFWSEREVTEPEALAFIRRYRPADRPGDLPPTLLATFHGEADDAFPLGSHRSLVELYRSAYERAGCSARFANVTYPGVGHWTSDEMRDDVVRFLGTAFA